MKALVLALVLLAVPAWAQAPRVTAVTPTAEAVNAPRDGDLLVQFDEALDPTTVTDATFRVHGRWTGVVPGTLSLEDGDQRIRFTPDAPIGAGDLVLAQVFVDGEQIEHHYWNRIAGEDHDLTGEQYRGNEAVRELSVVEDEFLRDNRGTMNQGLAARLEIMRAAVRERMEHVGARSASRSDR